MSRRQLGKRVRRRERGASAVEFALVLPVLSLLLFGLIAFGFVFAAQISLNNAARDASRAGVVQPLSGSALTCATIANNARTGSSTLGVQPVRVAVTVTGPTGTSCSLTSGSSTVSGSSTSTPCTGASSGALNVQMSYSMSPPGPFGSYNLSSKGIFQCEYQ